MDCGGGNKIELFSSAAPRTIYDEEAGNTIHFAFKVDNAVEWFNRAVEFGCSVHMDASKKVLPSIPPVNAVIGFVKGPDGELIEFFEEL